METLTLAASGEQAAPQVRAKREAQSVPYALPDDPDNRRKAQIREAARKHRLKRKAMGDREFRCTLRAMEVPGWEEWVEDEGHDPVEVLREALMYGMKFRMRMGRTNAK